MPVSAARTVTVTERVPRRVRLARADVEYLAARHAGRIDLAPTGRPGVYRLTSLGQIGVIAAPSCRLVLRPKVPLRSLLILLGADALSAVPGNAGAAPAGGPLDALAGLFARQLAERAAAGLHRGYAERRGPESAPRGRIEVAAQLRDDPARKDRVHCRYDEFTAEVPCNQVPAFVARSLIGSPLLGIDARAAVEGALRGWEQVAGVPPTPELLDAAERGPAEYRPLLALCRLLLDGLGPAVAAGRSAPAFLLDMERVFERYVTRGVAEAVARRPGWEVAAQPLHRVAAARAGAPDVELRPDVVVSRGGRPMTVVDAKWKRLPRHPLIADDLYQLVAYCTALGTGRGLLVYPGRRDRAWVYPFAAGLRVEVRTLRVTAGPDECRRSLRRLGRIVRGV